MLLSQLFYELGRLQFHTQLDETWLPFYQKFITSEFGQDYVVENSVGGRPLILALLGLSETFLQIFDYQLSQNTASRLVDIVPMLRPVHRVRALRFVETVNHEAFVQLVCSIPLAELDGDAQVQLISVLREHADVEIIRDHMQHTFTWKILGEAVQLSPGNLDLMIETAQVIQAGDFIQLLRYVLQPAYYQALLLGLTQGPFRQRVQSALVLHFLVHRGGAKAAQYLKEHAVVDVNPIAIFEQRFEKEATALLSQTAPVIKTLFPPTAGYTHIYLLGGAEQCLCPISQAIVSRLRLDNDAYHKLVCETNGVKTDLELRGGVCSAFVLDVVTKTLLNIFTKVRDRVLLLKPIEKVVHVNFKVSGHANIATLTAHMKQIGVSVFDAMQLLEPSFKAVSGMRPLLSIPEIEAVIQQIEFVPVTLHQLLNASSLYPEEYVQNPQLSLFEMVQTGQGLDCLLMQVVSAFLKLETKKYLLLPEERLVQRVLQISFYELFKLQAILNGLYTHRKTIDLDTFCYNGSGIGIYSKAASASELVEVRNRNGLCLLGILKYFAFGTEEAFDFQELVVISILTQNLIQAGLSTQEHQIAFELNRFSFDTRTLDEKVLGTIKKSHASASIQNISFSKTAPAESLLKSFSKYTPSTIQQKLGFSELKSRGPRDVVSAPEQPTFDSRPQQSTSIYQSYQSQIKSLFGHRIQPETAIVPQKALETPDTQLEEPNAENDSDEFCQMDQTSYYQADNSLLDQQYNTQTIQELTDSSLLSIQTPQYVAGEVIIYEFVTILDAAQMLKKNFFLERHAFNFIDQIDGKLFNVVQFEGKCYLIYRLSEFDVGCTIVLTAVNGDQRDVFVVTKPVQYFDPILTTIEYQVEVKLDSVFEMTSVILTNQALIVGRTFQIPLRDLRVYDQGNEFLITSPLQSLLVKRGEQAKGFLSHLVSLRVIEPATKPLGYHFSYSLTDNTLQVRHLQKNSIDFQLVLQGNYGFQQSLADLTSADAPAIEEFMEGYVLCLKINNIVFQCKYIEVSPRIRHFVLHYLGVGQLSVKDQRKDLEIKIQLKHITIGQKEFSRDDGVNIELAYDLITITKPNDEMKIEFADTQDARKLFILLAAAVLQNGVVQSIR